MEAADWFMAGALKSVSEIRFRNRPHNVGDPGPADKSGAVHGPELATPVPPPDARSAGADGFLNRTKEAAMGIFDRNYDRDFGGRGGAGYQGGDRDLGDRMRQGWNRMKNTAHDAMDRDDDGGYGYRGGAYGSNNFGRERSFGASGYDRDMGSGGYGYGAGGGNWQREGLNRLEGDNRDTFDRDSSWYSGRGQGMGMGGGGAWNYDRDFDRGNSLGASSSDMGGGYDRNYKGRWQTDNGDPFGDRASQTPIRMMRGGFQNGEDRGMMGSNYDRDFGRGYGAGSNMGYDRDMMRGGGMDRDPGYDPYGRPGSWGMQNNQNRNRGGYDRGWF
jgi:hypothetical protein